MLARGTSFSLKQYREDGYSGPIRGLTLQEAEEGCDRFFAALGQSKYEPGPARTDLSAWHHKRRWAYDLATHPAIVEAMAQILGENVVLWAMHFWYKEPGNEKYIPWHQDIHYWPMEPAVNATAWVSLGWSLRENGCLRLIPGSHRSPVEHIDLGDGKSAFGQGAAAEQVDESRALDIEMSPGQIVFFNERTLHGSGSNMSDIPRVAFSVRYTTPEVKFKVEEFGGNRERIQTFLVRGVDDYHLNDGIRGVVPAE
jgi:Protein involved in biosynthesis of mitomycin antibiotics/polyketide fumonisin